MRRLKLRKDVAERLRLGHPWIYRDALALDEDPPHASVVEVLGSDGRFVGRGLYDARSPIAVRLLSLDPGETLDASLLHRRIAAARRARAELFDPAETSAWRLVNGEGDFLPGVVIDRYHSTLVVQLEGPAEQAWREPLIEALREGSAPPRSIVLRRRGGAAVLLHGEEPPAQVEIREHGLRYLVDVRRGQKTGFFLDQRDNRRAIRRFSPGRRVANLFGYTGGFSLNAALAGAEQAITVDQAGPALAAARENFRLNGLDPERHGFVQADAFEWLEAEVAAGRRHDLLIVDPPSFAPSEERLGPALESYRRLNALALRALAPGGILATASCSSHVGAERFLEVLARAAADAGVAPRILEVRGQPPDHPSPAAFPEGRYLKFVLASTSR